MKDGDCREMCKTSSGCPSDDVMRRMMMTDKDCRECVQDQCGGYFDRHKTCKNICIFVILENNLTFRKPGQLQRDFFDDVHRGGESWMREMSDSWKTRQDGRVHVVFEKMSSSWQTRNRLVVAYCSVQRYCRG